MILEVTDGNLLAEKDAVLPVGTEVYSAEVAAEGGI